MRNHSVAPGGGRNVRVETIKQGVFRDCRAGKLHVSRKRLKLKAMDIYQVVS